MKSYCANDTFKKISARFLTLLIFHLCGRLGGPWGRCVSTLLLLLIYQNFILCLEQAVCYILYLYSQLLNSFVKTKGMFFFWT